MVNAGETITVIKWGQSLCRWFARRSFVRKFRDRSKLRLLQPVHEGFLHVARRLACQMRSEWDSEHEMASLLARDVCNACRMSICGVLKLRDSDVHCCLKVNLPKADGKNRVGTWARSLPLDGRPSESIALKQRMVDQSTVWCALMGKWDGETHWPKGITCFACNDLTKHGGKFRCDRPQWSTYYRSALVYPLRYTQKCDGSKMAYIGFLAFDSHRIGAFSGMPNIFDHIDRPAEYIGLLQASPIFHLGALFADTLGTFLGSAYELSLARGAIHGE